MTDSQARAPGNETSVPQPEASDERPSRLDLGISTAVFAVSGAVFGGLLTWAFDLRLVWQATGAFLGAVLVGGSGYSLAYLTLGFGPKHGLNDDSTIEPSLRRAILPVVVFVVSFAVFGALLGAMLGAFLPKGSPLLSLEYAGGMAAVAVGY